MSREGVAKGRAGDGGRTMTRILRAIGWGTVELSAMLVVAILARVGMVLVVVAGVVAGATAAGVLAGAFPFETAAPPAVERGAVSSLLHGLLGGEERVHDPLAAHRAFVGEARFNGGVVALLAMLALPILRGTLGIRGAVGTFGLGALMCAGVAGLVASGAGLVPTNPWWPTVLSPLPAVLVGMALWRLIYWGLEALSGLGGGGGGGGKGGGGACDGTEPSLDFDFSFDISPG